MATGSGKDTYTYGFFNSVNGDRKYNAADMSNYFEGLISDGVYENIGDKFVVKAGNGMEVTVGTGRAILKCRWIRNDAVLTLTLADADVQLSRTDYIVIKLDLSDEARDFTIEAVSTQPKDTEFVKYLILAKINIAAGTTAITQSMITDLRGTSSCLYVTGLVQQLDTDTLFLQWQEIFQKQYEAQKQDFVNWYDTLKDKLSIDTYINRHSTDIDLTQDYSGNKEDKIDIPNEWNVSAKDVIFVHLNGVFLTSKDVVITVETDSSGTTTAAYVKPATGKTWKKGGVLNITVLQSKIGSSTTGD